MHYDKPRNYVNSDAYRVVDSPIGPLLLATTDEGLVRVAFESEGHDEVLDELAADVSPRVLRAPARLDPAARELDEYFERRRRAFDLPLDLRLAKGFRRDVLGTLRTIGSISVDGLSAMRRATSCASSPTLGSSSAMDDTFSSRRLICCPAPR